MNRDELEGKGEQLKGKVKQAAGDLTDDQQLHDEGVVDETAGDVQEGFGRGRRKVGEALKDLGESSSADGRAQQRHKYQAGPASPVPAFFFFRG